MQKLLSLLFLFFIALHLSAQNVTLSGDVFDPILSEGVHEAEVKLLDAANDKVLAATKSRLNMIVEERDGSSTARQDTKSGAVFSLKIPSGFKDVVLVVSAAGYESVRKSISLTPGKYRYDIGTVHLLPAAKEKQLNEAMVTATKIKMYYKGDTLVYNADAFNVLKNESLRKLVEQLPNTKIENGVVYVNGKPIESLLFSGKDFFNGNVEAALDRLPAYIVSKLKVYEKQGELSELTGSDMHDKLYVMDVHLKREYIGTWMAKVQADAATEKLWGGQGFLMRMDDRQMLSINADVNNFNEERKMFDICDTSDPWLQGRHKNKMARVEYYFEPNPVWRIKSDASVQRMEQRTDSWTNTETFLTPFDMMDKKKSTQDDRNTRVSAFASLRARQSKKWQSELTCDFTFSNERETQDARTLAFWMKDDEDWHTWDADSIWTKTFGEGKQYILYTLLSPTLRKQKSFSYKPEWKTSFVLKGHLLNFGLKLDRNHVQTDLFNNYKLDYYANPDADHRRIFNGHEEHHTNAEATIDYVRKLGSSEKYDGLLTPYVSFCHRYGNLSHPYYRLERMEQWSESMDWSLGTLGMMPEGEWRSACFDAENSYYSKSKEQTAQGGLRTSHKFMGNKRGTLQLDADFCTMARHKRLNYQRNGQVYHPQRNTWAFQPTLTLKHTSGTGRKWASELWFNYKGEEQMPDLLDMLPITDDADPLNLFRGNPALGDKYTHYTALRYSLEQRNSQHNAYVSLQYRRVHHDITPASTFNAANGGRIYEMASTNRTHAASGDISYSLPLDKNKDFSLRFSVRGNYRQNADLSHLSSDDDRQGLMKQYGIAPHLKLNGAVGKNFRFSSSWNTEFSAIRQSGANTQYRETTLRADFSWQLPWNLQLASDFRATMYHGFSNASINKAHCKWNAALARTFLDDKLSLRFTANGILTPRNFITSTVNATTRVESYTDILPRYFMLSLVYRLEWTQKSKNSVK